MGLFVAFALMLAAAGALVLLGLPRRLWSLALGVLLLAGTGYAWQGRPDQPAAPALPDAAKYPIEPTIAELRSELFGRFNYEGQFFTITDALEADGDTADACKIMFGGVHQAPRNAALWTWLGTTIATHDRGVSPAARLAFHRAIQLAPAHPGPPFFTGEAYVRAGQFDEARPFWAKALALSPANAAFHDQIAARLRLLDMLLDMRRRAGVAHQ